MSTEGPTTEIIVFTDSDFGRSRRTVPTINDLAAHTLHLKVEKADVWQKGARWFNTT